MIEIPLPRLLDNTGAEVRRITPLHASVALNKTPLSTASLELSAGEKLNNRAWVEMYTINGSAGIFRVASPQTGYGNQRGAVDLEHGAAEIGDSIVSAPTSGTYTVAQAFSTLFSFYKGTRWRLGTVEATGTIAGDWDGENVLEAMIALLEQIPGYHLEFVQNTTPWTVNVRQDPAVVSAEGRLDRNVSNAIVAEDGTSQVTRLYMEGLPGGYIEADNIAQVGVIERFLAGGGEDLTPESAAQLEADARRYINKHKIPLKSVQISGYDFYAVTGESLDKLELCKLYRLELPEDNTTISANISSLTFDDVYGDPYSATVTLDEPDFGISTVLSRIEQELGISSGYGSGKGQRKKQEETHYRHEVKETKEGMSDSFGIIGVKIGADGMPMKDASGNYIWDDTGTGGEIWGHLNRNAWTTVIQNHIQDANGRILSIGQVLTSADGQALITAINDQQTGTATINANRVRISGAVTIEDTFGISNGSLLVKPMAIFGNSGNLVTINNGAINADTLQVNSGGSLKFGDGTGYGYRSINAATAGNLVTGFGSYSASGGQISIPYYTVAIPAGSGAQAGNINFNIADTKYFQDEVSAAYERGKSEGSASSTNIDLANSGQIYLHTADPGSGYTNLGSLGSKITEGKSNGSAYVSFQATCDGGKTYKYYKIPL